MKVKLLPIDSNLAAMGLEYSTNKEEVLNGLSKGEFGFLIGPPDVGKGWLSISIILELATATKVVGVSPVKKPMKTLYWPAEDGVKRFSERIHKLFTGLPEHIKNQVAQNSSVFEFDDSDFIATVSKIASERESASKSMDALLDALKGFDFLIIDTGRRSINADEVADDLIFLNAFSTVAKKANVAVLIIHHPTKATSQGKELVTSVSGAGLSKALATSRLNLYLNLDAKGTHKLSHAKSNFIEHELKITGQPLFFNKPKTILSAVKDFQFPARNHQQAKHAVNQIASTTNVVQTIEKIVDAEKIVDVLSSQKEGQSKRRKREPGISLDFSNVQRPDAPTAEDMGIAFAQDLINRKVDRKKIQT